MMKSLQEIVFQKYSCDQVREVFEAWVVGSDTLASPRHKVTVALTDKRVLID